MNAESWLEANNRYLTASLKWLRLRLWRLAPAEPPAPAEPSPPAAKPCWLRRLKGGNPAPASEFPLLPESRRSTLEEQIEQAAAERAAAAKTDPPPALIRLAQRFGLSDFERDTLLLCAAMELDPGLAALCARAQGSPTRNYPTFGLALSAFDDPRWDALSAQRPLRYAQLIVINQPGVTPLTASALGADERIFSFLKGLNVFDHRLDTLLDPVAADGGLMLAESQQAVVEILLQRLRQAAGESLLPVVQLLGADTGSKLAVAQQTCAALSRYLYRTGSEDLPSQVAEIETLARLWQRESLLLPVALYIDAEAVDGGPAEAVTALQRFLSRQVGLIFLGMRETPLRLNCPHFSVDVNKPTAVEQREAWISLLSGHTAEPEIDPIAHQLAGQFNLNLRDIEEVASLALQMPVDDGALSELLWETCRDLTRPRLDVLAQRLEPKATWEDLVLPAEPMNLLRQIAGQVRERYTVYEDWGFARKMNRGFGISTLFAGESGTGKTMAAEVIANDLRLNLYRIDLSAVVSKYIGETEKNLRKLFDAAERGGAMLFFDEADALFGKRSEVKDSHDRYANIETSYLLQRMEAFSGLAILATNMKSALDPAFMRRLRFKVEFKFPSAKERMLIWQKALPPQTPREALDYERLARMNLTGGNIHSIALNAAFLAARANTPVTMRLVLDAALSELRKLDKPINAAEFRLMEAVK